MTDSSVISPDARILASDGTELGLVAAVGNDDLQLQLPVGVRGGPQDSIPLSWVATVEFDTVRLNRPEAEARAIMNHEIPTGIPPA